MKALIVAIFISITATSCEKETIIGSGNSQTELRHLSGFTKIKVEGSTDLIIDQGNVFKVEAKAYNNLLPYLETKVVNGTLLIGFRQGTSVSNDNSAVYITLPSLASLAASGNSRVDIRSGNADDFEATIIGAVAIYAFGFTAKEARIKIEGSGDVELTVTEKLHASITGSGNVYYKGTAAVTSSINGSGNVIKR